MRKTKRMLHINIILIYFTFIYSQNHHHSTYRYTHVLAATSEADESATNDPLTTTTTTTKTSDENIAIYDMLREDVKLIEEKFKEKAKEYVYGLKGQPEPMPSERVFVPRAMLEAYMEMRDEVRAIIPDDKDFLGKINIDDMYDQSGDIWSAVYNKYGGADITVEMESQKTSSESSTYRFKGDASHIAEIRPNEPEDVPPNIEPHLPPHAEDVKSQKQFHSVHLKFNLSQSALYQEPTALDDLRGAELYLSRERLYNCLFHECAKKRPIPFFNKNKSSSSNTNNKNSKDEADASSGGVDELQDSNGQPVPRFQQVYILQIHGYNDNNQPLTTISDFRRIRTDETTPLVFDVYPLVKTWLKNPKSNYGIIIRVTNDDKNYEETIKHLQQIRRKLTRSTSDNNDSTIQQATNASADYNIELQSITPLRQVLIPDHVRLKRGFRSESDDNQDWLKHQPSILVYSKPQGKRHVKRHHEDAESMQADSETMPFQTGTASYVSTSTTSSNSKSDNLSEQQQAQQATPTTSESSPPRTPSSTAGPWNRREQLPNRSRPGSARNYPSNSQRTQHQSGQRSKSKGKQSGRPVDRCSKRSMTINFDEVGWSNWIIAPQAYYANYCAGDCTWPLADTQNATNHAIIQAIYQSVGRVVPKSCCAPVRLGPMAILYQLDGIVQMRKYDDMIVDACGCL